MLDVHLVLNQLDDAHDEVGVTQPAEHIIEHRHILVLNTFGNAVREGGKHHARNIGMFGLDFACHGKGVVISVTRHTDYQVDIRVV